MTDDVVFQFDEDKLLLDAIEHIRETYKKHYSGGIQVTEFIMSHANSLDWPRANAVKYVMRYGKKAGYNKDDLLKALHYITLMYFFANKNEGSNGTS